MQSYTALRRSDSIRLPETSVLRSAFFGSGGVASSAGPSPGLMMFGLTEYL